MFVDRDGTPPGCLVAGRTAACHAWWLADTAATRRSVNIETGKYFTTNIIYSPAQVAQSFRRGTLGLLVSRSSPTSIVVSQQSAMYIQLQITIQKKERERERQGAAFELQRNHHGVYENLCDYAQGVPKVPHRTQNFKVSYLEIRNSSCD